MKLDFKFSNLCGTVYKQGNLIFTPDGNSIVSPVGNRVTVFDLVNNKSYTFPFEARKNISRIALSPDAALLIAVDEDGRALFVNFPRRVVLFRHNFKEPIRDVQFSPNGRFIAVAKGKHIQMWRSPAFTFEFSPFVLHRTYTGHFNDVVHISWYHDSQFFITGSKDMTARIYSVDPVPDFKPIMLTGHRDAVVGAWFDHGDNVWTVSKDGALFQWKVESRTDADEGDGGMDVDGGNDDTESMMTKRKRTKTSHGLVTSDTKRWRIVARHYFNQNHAKVTTAAFQSAANILTVGFSSGVFGIWELPDFNNIHVLSISQKRIDAVAMNPTGEWLAFGSAKLGQLLVWEWKSESYVLKQQGHHHFMNCLSYSPDGQFIATGGDDGKVKVWNTQSGFCFVTFTDHAANVTAIEFAKKGQVVFSASKDGTVRAFDLIRYRNFRTFTSPTPVQFGCLAVDPSGEVVCAGSIDTFEIYMWSVATGKLLDIFSGHEGPISCLAFSPLDGTLASGSWDKTARVWEAFSRDRNTEVYEHKSEVLAVTFRPDGRQLSSTTLDGQICAWNVRSGELEKTIEGRNDIAGGRLSTDKVTAANSAAGKHFTSLCYTADGSCILAGGNSKYICIYDVATQMLLKRFQTTHNLSLDGIQEMLNSKNMTEAGALDLIDDAAADLSDLEDRMDQSLPGVRAGDMSLRKTRPEARTRCVRFAPTGRSWAAATTEGLLLYSLDEQIIFDPFDLEIDITEETILETLAEGDHLKALVMSLRLGEQHLIHHVFNHIPADSIPLVVRGMPTKYLDRVIKFLSSFMDLQPQSTSKSQGTDEDSTATAAHRPVRIEFQMVWATSILRYHATFLKDRSIEYASGLRALQKAMTTAYENLSRICDDNTYMLQYLLNMMSASNGETHDFVDMDVLFE